MVLSQKSLTESIGTIKTLTKDTVKLSNSVEKQKVCKSCEIMEEKLQTREKETLSYKSAYERLSQENEVRKPEKLKQTMKQNESLVARRSKAEEENEQAKR